MTPPRGRHRRHLWWAACTLLAAGPVLAADHRLAPAGAAMAPAGYITAADLQDQLLVDGDKVLLDCGARYPPLRLRTRGAGTVRVEPAGPCTAGRRPVFDGRRPPGVARKAADATAGGAGRSTFTQPQPVAQVFAGDQPLHGTRTPGGSHSVALLASVIDTCRLRCASATDFLARAIHAARLGLPASAFAPIPANLANPNTDLVGV